MKKYLSVLALTLFLLLGSTSVIHAHSGTVSENNCHTCTFQCEAFNLEYDEQHCHKGEPLSPEEITIKSKSNSHQITGTLGGYAWDQLKSFIINVFN